jgi:hypothetical protein
MLTFLETFEEQMLSEEYGGYSIGGIPGGECTKSFLEFQVRT